MRQLSSGSIEEIVIARPRHSYLFPLDAVASFVDVVYLLCLSGYLVVTVCSAYCKTYTYLGHYQGTEEISIRPLFHPSQRRILLPLST